LNHNFFKRIFRMTCFNEIMSSLPDEYPVELHKNNRLEFLNSELSVIILDDDPTGTQTIYDVPVLTTWGVDEIEKELKNNVPLFFILTNSRSLTPAQAKQLAQDAGENIKKAIERTGRKILVISRSDSTLRGHYPVEVDALGEGLGIKESPHILIPAFFQGGRYTINDVHYVLEGDEMIPAGKTNFARDPSFGYHSSDLKDYVEEKTGGRIKSNEVTSITLEDIRKKGPERVSDVLSDLHDSRVCIVNAASQSDLDVFTSGFFKALRKGLKPVLFRTAASIIPSLVGLKLKEPVERGEIKTEGKGGVIAVGSYVPRTSGQLEYLKNNYRVEYIEVQAKRLLTEDGFKTETKRVSGKVNNNLANDKVVVIFTSRELIKGNSTEESLKIVNQISAGMTEIVRGIEYRPRFFIAKGGITSSDILTKAFNTKKAQVLGQIIPGVPLWQLNDSTPFPGMVYIPFPGNVGGEDALYKAVRKFT